MVRRLDAETLERGPEDWAWLLGVVPRLAGGLEPGPDQALASSVHPALGGAISVENVEVADYVVASSVCGQLHGQVDRLPPGAPITGVTTWEWGALPAYIG